MDELDEPSLAGMTVNGGYFTLAFSINGMLRSGGEIGMK
jgi:hypothetical protein